MHKKRIQPISVDKRWRGRKVQKDGGVSTVTRAFRMGTTAVGLDHHGRPNAPIGWTLSRLGKIHAAVLSSWIHDMCSLPGLSSSPRLRTADFDRWTAISMSQMRSRDSWCIERHSLTPVSMTDCDLDMGCAEDAGSLRSV